MGIAITPAATTVDRIRHIHGGGVASELIEFNVSDSRLGFKASGRTSTANYRAKRITILLFINHRSVESSAVKSAIQRTYSTFLPKGGHPFVYLDIEIDPQRVDVNVHPTKREVNFLNEDEIIEMVCDQISIELSKVDTSRTFMTQSLLPGSRGPSLPETRTTPTLSSGPSRSSVRPAENNLVRTDPSLRKITSMLPSGTNTKGSNPSDGLSYTIVDRPRMQLRLTTVKELQAEVRNSMHNNLTQVFSSHTYIGVVDTARRIVAIQSGVKLYLVDYGMVCNEYFYQLGLTDFCNYGSIVFEQPLDLRELISIAAEAEAQAIDHRTDLSKVPEKVRAVLVEKREMLSEYFNMEISETGQLQSIPLLIRGYMPSLAKLPRFLMRLGPCVNWDREKECFETFLTELASFYTPEQLPNPPETKVGIERSLDDEDDNEHDSDEDQEIKARRDQLTHMLEHVLFSAFRSRLVATKGLLKGVVEVANLKGLYRVFERC